MSYERFVSFWYEQPFLAGVIALLMACIAYALVRQSRYAWYFVILYVVLGFSLLVEHPLAFCVFLLGGVAGCAEFLGKFRDEPVKALKTFHAMSYLAFNGLIAVFAYIVIVAYGTMTSTLLDQIKIVVIAGLGSMLIMRSRLFSVSVNNEEIAFGPEQVIKVYLRFLESAVDRVRAEDRYNKVREIMRDVKFDEACKHAIVALDSAQIVKEDERQKVVQEITAIKNDANLDWQYKSYRLGYVLFNLMGEDFLTTVFSKDKLPATMLAAAPLPAASGGLFALFTADGTENYMAFATNMSFAALRDRLGWTTIPLDRIRSTITRQKCRLQGYRLVFNVVDVDDPSQRYGLANIVPDADSSVEGVVYKLPKEALPFLDNPKLGYHEEEVRPSVGDKETKACAYTSRNTREDLKPSADYLARVVRAAREAGLSPEYIDAIARTPTARASTIAANG